MTATDDAMAQAVMHGLAGVQLCPGCQQPMIQLPANSKGYTHRPHWHCSSMRACHVCCMTLEGRVLNCGEVIRKAEVHDDK